MFNSKTATQFSHVHGTNTTNTQTSKQTNKHFLPISNLVLQDVIIYGSTTAATDVIIYRTTITGTDVIIYGTTVRATVRHLRTTEYHTTDYTAL